MCSKKDYSETDYFHPICLFHSCILNSLFLLESYKGKRKIIKRFGASYVYSAPPHFKVSFNHSGFILECT